MDKTQKHDRLDYIKAAGTIVAIIGTLFGAYMYYGEFRTSNREIYLRTLLDTQKKSIEIAAAIVKSTLSDPFDPADELEKFNLHKFSNLALVADNRIMKSAECFYAAASAKKPIYLKSHLYYYTLDIRAAMAKARKVDEFKPEKLAIDRTIRFNDSTVAKPFRCYEFVENNKDDLKKLSND